jgi:hypothetical protein
VLIATLTTLFVVLSHVTPIHVHHGGTPVPEYVQSSLPVCFHGSPFKLLPARIAAKDGLSVATAHSAGPSGYWYVGASVGLDDGSDGAYVGSLVGSDGVTVGVVVGHGVDGQCVPVVYVSLYRNAQLCASFRYDGSAAKTACTSAGTVPLR